MNDKDSSSSLNKEIKINVPAKKKERSLSSMVNGMRYFYFSYYFSVGCIQGFQSLIYKKIGLKNSHLGTIAAIGLTGGIISPVTVGYIADKTKRSKLILTIMVSCAIFFTELPITCICLTMLGHKATPNPLLNNSQILISTKRQEEKKLTILYILLCFAQFASTFCDQGTKALTDSVSHMVCDIGKKKETPVAWSKIRMFGGLGIGLANLCSGFLMSYIKKLVPASMPAEMFLVMTSLTMAITCILTVIFTVPDAEAKEAVSFKETLKSLFIQPTIFFILLVQFLLQFGNNLTKYYESLYISHLGGAHYLVGLSSSMNYFLDCTFMFFSTTLTEVIGTKEATLLIVTLFGTIRAIFYAFSDNAWLAINNSVMTGFIFGMQVPTLSLLVKELAPRHLISSYCSLLTTVGKIGATIASKTGGSLSESYGYRSMYLIASGFFISSVIVIFVLICYKQYVASKKEKGNDNDHKDKDKICC